MTGHSNVVLRNAVPDHVTDIRRIFWETWHATYSAFIPEADLEQYFSERYSVEALHALFQSGDVHGAIADVDGVPVGAMITRFRKDEGRFYVSSLYVLPSCQGTGVGRALMQLASSLARERGVKQIWLGVMSKNLSALRWYERQGFQFIEELPFTMGGTTVHHLIGYKDI